MVVKLSNQAKRREDKGIGTSPQEEQLLPPLSNWVSCPDAVFNAKANELSSPSLVADLAECACTLGFLTRSSN